MADRYPLVYNPSANQLQELQSGDSLDLGNAGLKNVTTITAVGFKTSGGTSAQFLKADGSIDSNTYLTSAGTVALAQGRLVLLVLLLVMLLVLMVPLVVILVPSMVRSLVMFPLLERLLMMM